MKNTLVISAFPGTGKTYFFNNRKDQVVLDSDSSEFSWIKDENGNNTPFRNPEFPNNYIEHIKQNIGVVDIIFVSSHDVVRQALADNNIEYIIVYPDISCKDEYLKRYRARGNDEKFINMMDKNWEKFIEGMENDKGNIHSIKLQKDWYISTVIKIQSLTKREFDVYEY